MWLSQIPGTNVLPLPSITRVPTGALRLPALPIATILPLLASTAWSATNNPLSASNSRTLSNNIGAWASVVRNCRAMPSTVSAVTISWKSRIFLALATLS